MVAQGLAINRRVVEQHLAELAFGAVERTGASMVVFVQFEIRQCVVPTPACVTGDVGPVVVVTRLAAHVNHAVDAGAATQHLAAWVAQAAPVQARIGGGVIQPIGAGIANAIQVADRNVHPVVIVFATGFNEQHTFAGIGTEAVGQQTTGSAGANDDVVKLGVAHGGIAYLDVGMTNSAPLPMLSGQRCMTLFCLV